MTIKSIKANYYKMGAMLTAGILTGAGDAFAGSPKNFGDVSKSIIESIADVPALLSALSYMFGLLLGVLGIMKIKDHVENPTQTALKDGAIRLAAGGALFSLPLVFEAMSSVTTGGTAVTAAKLKKVEFSID